MFSIVLQSLLLPSSSPAITHMLRTIQTVATKGQELVYTMAIS